MRVEPNKKMVYLHISAYKSIIADLRDEIDKLKSQLKSESDSEGRVGLGLESAKLGAVGELGYPVASGFDQQQLEEDKSKEKD